ncbi:MAG: hypothetical protein POH28_13135 [Acidocella sp.]|nr:hypothetical protein [Acidocella sp.]
MAIDADFSSQIGLGVRDQIVSEDCPARDYDHKHTGIIAKIGPYLVDDFAYAIKFLADGGSSETIKRDVNPRHVLAQAWNLNRLEDATKRARENIFDGPVRVVGFQFPGLPDLYLVNDGMHRTVAARLAGRPLISATILGHWFCNPACAAIRGRFLYVSDGYGGFRRRQIDKEVMDILRGLGVVDHTPTIWKSLQSGLNSVQNWYRKVADYSAP